MHIKPLLTLFFFLFLFKINAQVNKELNSDVLAEKLRNVENTEFWRILNSYNQNITARPNDYELQIERCKFVDVAQYDEAEEYNPNQGLVDSLKNILYDTFKNEPRVILYKTSQLWGDEKKEYLEEVEKKVEEGKWAIKDKATFYVEFAKVFFGENEFNRTKENFEIAIKLDPFAAYHIEYPSALIELNREVEAKKTLNSVADTTQDTYYLMQKADLLITLKDYKNATSLYNKILKINPEQINNGNIAKAFEKNGQYNEARKYLLLDTAKTWDRLNPKLNLFLHDLEFQSAGLCLASYEAFRDQGIINDIFGIYRLQLFLKHPFAMWSFRDLLGIFLFVLLFLSSLVFPYLWLVPVKVGGEFLKLRPEKVPSYFSYEFKDVWFVFFVIVFATFSTTVFAPNSLYNTLGSKLSIETMSDFLIANIQLAFMFIIAILIFFFIQKKPLKAFLPNNWSLAKCFYIPFATLWGIKICLSIYSKLMMGIFEIDIYNKDSEAFVHLTLNEEIINLIKTYGIVISIFMLAIVVPIYEEIIFRGVTLNGLISKFGFRYANIVQATLFGLAHQDLWLFPFYFLFGLVTANMLRKSDSLLPGIIFHMLNNLLATIAISHL
jgi:uncharacterized protein